MNTLNDIWDRFKRSGFLIVFGIFSFYFVINAIKGDRGIFRYMYLKGKIEVASQQRARYAARKKDLEKKVAMLSEQSLDLDYLEERARIVLNMVKEGEYVILDGDIDNK
ncbi:MAG: septum formation initiator family protein [Alphaproteobacteria bacterium]|nr:septum formation initiator family protein [Alphaproteobacteria bacterium]